MIVSIVSYKQTRGATLIIALLFMVIMAMLGVAIANVSILEERMAGGSRDREIALQAAETALRDAESRLAEAAFRANFPLGSFDATNANSAAYWETCFTGSPAVDPCTTTYTPVIPLPTTGTGAVAAQPEFVVERKPNLGSMEIYRVTTRSVGGTADAVVVLQAEFAFSP